MRDDFGAFILTHGRPKQVTRTVNALRRAGYTGKWWLVLDDEDDTRPEYEARWGADRILTFTKRDDLFDLGDNGGSRSVVVYARNALDALAKQVGVSWYVHLDDDYSHFAYRYAESDHLWTRYVRQLDRVLAALVDFAESAGALTVAMAQGGDFIGGASSERFRAGLIRKAMNTFVVRAGRPVPFVGRINEDVNTYVTLAGRGELLFTATRVSIEQPDTQTQAGGMTDAYRDGGTYAKSFYTVMMAPSSARVSVMGETQTRIHHRINWNQTAPKILSDRWKRRPA